ncbi:hypothetical protein COL154_004405 [Colletotrichum chrysophilum]|uniref:uncharacterized protein n=1 Tax=Colletotrichum chrysophilum TaxID=1836956 RepID=UPI0023010216|nr:uncharacterized protein COL26b_009989 [Colletotrichum chrysophilum]KAJ0344651.1 hypothetical protein KNSL1_009148 [Colletotrichum chrysophilum]KAJ0365548.1 hypothetical protein COL154_004405 [Colletotrichum chrysophilum]KAJ0370523.1 hypothetical protein COL26b_009989 [Colletotrichum chrysophilum]
MDIPDHMMFSRRLAELAGQSRDHNLRPLLEERANNLIDDLFWGEDDLASEWFDANISLVINLKQNPGTIFLGKHEVMEYFKKLYEEEDTYQLRRLNFVLISADRGRVTSHIEQFSAQFNVDSPVGPTKKEVILVTMDLNDSNKIQRMEYRLLCKEHDAEQTPHWDWDETVDSLKTKPVVIDYNI